MRQSEGLEEMDSWAYKPELYLKIHFPNMGTFNIFQSRLCELSQEIF